MLAADRGAPEQAAAHYDACERLAEAGNDRHLVALCLLNRAEVLLALARSAEARRDVAAAERAFESLGAHFDAADVLRVLALCDQAEGLLGMAEARLQQARELADITGARLTEAEATRDLGRLFAVTGRKTLARLALDEAARAFDGLGAMAEVELTERELAVLGVERAAS
jgi:tetratricopeptide (TPR) repeat protein